MPEGTGLSPFAAAFPGRFFDVGIAEQHAVTFSAALARKGFKPLVAIYSTFLQRAYDQIVHDVCLQDLGIVLCLDRAGLVGEDGPTHHGSLDISYLRSMPHIVVMAPRDQEELNAMLELAVAIDRPVAIRYPRGGLLSKVSVPPINPVELGKAELLRHGKDLAIIAVGSMVYTAYEAAECLSREGIEATVVNARFIKPLDRAFFEELVRTTTTLVTIEEGVVEGGFGSAILEFIEAENIPEVKVKRIGLPSEFIEHGKRTELLTKFNLNSEGICRIIKTEVMCQQWDALQ
jgi:1-deoxy-D-xylulose-5-phosphate synthase